MSAEPEPAAVAIDWGTTNLRIWPLDRTGQPFAERTSGQGMSTLSREQFPDVMAEHFRHMGVARTVPVIVCGMAGSRQGWVEAKYLPLPVRLDGLAAAAVQFEANGHAVAIIPGAAKYSADAPDVMRSEETQLAGLVNAGVANGYVCMPGTHTKWAQLSDGKLIDFHTTMTGELFELIKSRSILSHSLDEIDIDVASSTFADAVQFALDQPEQVVTRLFSLRASDLLNQRPKDQLLDRLSGLLIGLDVSAGRKRMDEATNLTLVGGNQLGKAYYTALSLAGCDVEEYDGEALAVSGLANVACQLWPDRFVAMTSKDRVEA